MFKLFVNYNPIMTAVALLGVGASLDRWVAIFNIITVTNFLCIWIIDIIEDIYSLDECQDLSHDDNNLKSEGHQH